MFMCLYRLGRLMTLEAFTQSACVNRTPWSWASAGEGRKETCEVEFCSVLCPLNVLLSLGKHLSGDENCHGDRHNKKGGKRNRMVSYDTTNTD